MTKLARAAVTAAFGLELACGTAAAPVSEPTPKPAAVTVVVPAPDAPGTPPPQVTVSSAAPAPEIDTSGPPYPIVLAHGMAGFTRLKNIPLDYFNGIRDDLIQEGELDVFATTVPPFDTSEVRAPILAAQIESILAQTGKKKVNLIGHSQGGLDARVLVSPAGLGLGDRIASVTTVASPHRGSRVADVVLLALGGAAPNPLDEVTNALLDLLQESFYDAQSDPQLRAQLVNLSEAYMSSTFNPRYVDDPSVPWFSYAGRTNSDGGTLCDGGVQANEPNLLDLAQVELLPFVSILENGQGTANDGLVTVPSARWGTFIGCVPADHLKEVAQIGIVSADPVSGFDAKIFYRQLVGRLRFQGL